MESRERRSHGGDLAFNTRGMTDRDEAHGGGALCADGEQRGPGDTDGPGGQGGAVVKIV